VSAGGAPPGWYPDPGGGGQRYFDGAAWTGHTAPSANAYAAATPPWGAPPWKGAIYGRPAHGPGSLTDPGRRLAARMLDGLVFLPVIVVCVAIAVALVAPHAGPIFPKQNPDPNATVATPGFLWLYLAAVGAAFVGGVLFVVYETVSTARYGRTLGKRWMKIRPVTLDGHALGWGRSLGRAASYWLASSLGWLGLLDYLWCVWDANTQCVHDKVAGTLVVND
jgi:uncharacterized RDD family membrane protein YckC